MSEEYGSCYVCRVSVSRKVLKAQHGACEAHALHHLPYDDTEGTQALEPVAHVDAEFFTDVEADAREAGEEYTSSDSYADMPRWDRKAIGAALAPRTFDVTKSPHPDDLPESWLVNIRWCAERGFGSAVLYIAYHFPNEQARVA